MSEVVSEVVSFWIWGAAHHAGVGRAVSHIASSDVPHVTPRRGPLASEGIRPRRNAVRVAAPEVAVDRRGQGAPAVLDASLLARTLCGLLQLGRRKQCLLRSVLPTSLP